MPKIHIASPSGHQEELEESQLHAKWQQGEIQKGSLYWKEGMATWQPIADFIASATPIASGPPRIPAAAPQAADPNAPFNPYAAPVYHPQQPAELPAGQYRFAKNPRLLTNVLTVFLGLYLLSDIVTILGDLAQYSLLGRPYTIEEGESNDARQQMIGVVSIVAYLATVIVFGMWIYRAGVNSRGFGARGMEYTPGWAVGWYFVPIMNLFRPYQAMKEIWKVSTNPDEWDDQNGSPILVAWWTLWIVSNIITNISSRIATNADTISGLQGSTIFSIVATIISCVLTVIAIIMVRTLNQRQETLVARSAGVAPI